MLTSFHGTWWQSLLFGPLVFFQLICVPLTRPFDAFCWAFFFCCCRLSPCSSVSPRPASLVRCLAYLHSGGLSEAWLECPLWSLPPGLSSREAGALSFLLEESVSD